MKINRGATCYFKKWITKKKLQELKEIIVEYSRMYFIWIEWDKRQRRK